MIAFLRGLLFRDQRNEEIETAMARVAENSDAVELRLAQVMSQLRALEERPEPAPVELQRNGTDHHARD